jgi:hypothetical protein
MLSFSFENSSIPEPVQHQNVWSSVLNVFHAPGASDR